MQETVVRDVRVFLGNSEDSQHFPIYWPLLLLLIVLPAVSAFQLFLHGSWSFAIQSLVLLSIWGGLLWFWNRKQIGLAARDARFRKARLQLIQTGLLVLAAFAACGRFWMFTADVPTESVTVVGLFFGVLLLLSMTAARPLVGVLLPYAKLSGAKARVPGKAGSVLLFLAIGAFIGIPEILAPDSFVANLDELLLVSCGVVVVSFGGWCLSTGIQMGFIKDQVIEELEEDS